MAIVAEVVGAKSDGSRACIRGSIVVDQREANRRRGTTAERFLTAGALATAVALLTAKGTLRPGVLAPEELPPQPLQKELESRAIRFTIDERPA